MLTEDEGAELPKQYDGKSFRRGEKSSRGENGRKNGIIAAVVILIVLAAGAAVFFGTRSGDGGQNNTDYRDLVDVEEAFAEGTITYSEAVKEIGRLKKSIDPDEDEIDDTMAYLNEMNFAREAFERAEELKTAGEYLKAITEYKKVANPEDCNYQAAGSGIAFCRGGLRDETLRAAVLLAAAGNYSAAAAKAEEGIGILGGDAILENQKELYAAKKDTDPYAEVKEYPFPRVASAETVGGEVYVPDTAVGGEHRNFGAESAVNGSYDDCWCAVSGEDGTGAAIRLDLSEKTKICGVRIVNGDLIRLNDDVNSGSGQVESFTLTFSNGKEKKFTASYNADGSSEYQYFIFPKPIVSSSVILTVTSVYEGSEHSAAVALNELAVF